MRKLELYKGKLIPKVTFDRILKMKKIKSKIKPVDTFLIVSNQD